MDRKGGVNQYILIFSRLWSVLLRIRESTSSLQAGERERGRERDGISILHDTLQSDACWWLAQVSWLHCEWEDECEGVESIQTGWWSQINGCKKNSGGVTQVRLNRGYKQCEWNGLIIQNVSDDVLDCIRHCLSRSSLSTIRNGEKGCSCYY